MSLITRQDKGSKLTIQDLDNNLIYLENLALSASASLGTMSEFSWIGQSTTGFDKYLVRDSLTGEIKYRIGGWDTDCVAYQFMSDKDRMLGVGLTGSNIDSKLHIQTDGLVAGSTSYMTSGLKVEVTGASANVYSADFSGGLGLRTDKLIITGNGASEFLNGTQSLLYLGTNGDFSQNNLNSNYRFINGTISSFFGTISYIGESFETGTEAYYNGIGDYSLIGSSTQSSIIYVDSFKAVTYRFVASETDAIIDAVDFSGLSSINAGMIVTTYSVNLGWQGNNITNSIEIDDSGIINLLTSTTSNPTFRIVDNFTNTRFEIDSQGEFLQTNSYGIKFYNSSNFNNPYGTFPSAGIYLTNSNNQSFGLGVTDPTSAGGNTSSAIQYIDFNTFQQNLIVTDTERSSLGSSYIVGSSSYAYRLEANTSSVFMEFYDGGISHGVAVTEKDINIAIKATSSGNFNLSNVNGDNLLDINGEGNLRLRNGQIVGTVSLSGGSATVTNSYVDSNSIIFVTKQNSTSTYSVASVNQSSGQFDIQSTNPSDTDVVGWMLINPIL